uniref:Putative secreted metalloprotease n=1 Tax=Ixodes ricinus TaxID=34613 RepID=A0A6B0V8F4_IXORI
MGSTRSVKRFLVILNLSAFIGWATAATVSSLRNQQDFDKLEHHMMSLEVQLLYDDKFLQSDVKLSNAVDQYLSALLKAAQLRFLDMANPVIELTLTETTHVNDDFVIRYGKGDFKGMVNYYYSVQYMKDGALGYGVSFDKADIVLFVTGHPVEPPTLRQHGSWIGVPTIGGACTKDKFGLIYDNGASFSGAADMSQQIAFLLGAAGPRRSDGSLLSQPGGGSYYYGLNEDDKNAIRRYYKRNHETENCCWKDRPRPMIPKYPADFLLQRSVDICRETFGPSYHECPKFCLCCPDRKWAKHGMYYMENSAHSSGSKSFPIERTSLGWSQLQASGRPPNYCRMPCFMLP